MTQDEQALAAFDKARAGSKDKPPRGEWGALHDAPKAVNVVERSVGEQRPRLITYTLGDGTALWRHATKAVLHIRTRAIGKAA
jgi:hypothetical protein